MTATQAALGFDEAEQELNAAQAVICVALDAAQVRVPIVIGVCLNTAFGIASAAGHHSAVAALMEDAARLLREEADERAAAPLQ